MRHESVNMSESVKSAAELTSANIDGRYLAIRAPRDANHFVSEVGTSVLEVLISFETALRLFGYLSALASLNLFGDDPL